VIPTSEGVWRWKRKDDGREFDLPVYDLGPAHGVSLYPQILWMGTHMDIDAFLHGTWVAKVSHNPDSRITKQIRGWIHPEDYPFTTA
jgi:hypothetical protein